MKFKKSLASLLSTAVVMPTACHTAIFAESGNLNQSDLENETFKTRDFSNEIQQIIRLGFTVNGKPISENESLNVLKLNLFEDNNLDIALANGIQFILDDKESPYIDNKSSMIESIRRNTLIFECLQSTMSYVQNSNVDKNDKDLEIFKRLHTIEAMIKNDADIPEDNQVFKFISSMRCAYQVIISRRIAKEILEQSRDSMEQKLNSKSNSASVGVSDDSMGIGITTDFSTNQTSTESTLYKVDNSGSLGINVSAGLEKYLSANIGFALSLTNSLIFYSLEQFLDTGMADGNISFLKLTDDEIKQVISSRKNMQDAESVIIPKMQNSIEYFLKATNVLPQKLMLAWPKSTDYSTNEKSSEFNVKSYVGAAASCLASLGFDVSAETSIKKTSTLHPYLELINENCEVTEYCKNVNDLIDFLGVSDYPKFTEIVNATEVYIDSKENSSNAEVLSMLISNLTGDLKQYNSSLATMADKDVPAKDKKSARVIKKNMEKEWIGSGKIDKLHHNRENILKIAIALAAYLKSKSIDESENELFAPLYNEIDHLSDLQKFTNKLALNPKNGFKTSRKSKSVAATGQTALEIPFVGATAFSVSYSENESPLYTENSKDVTVKTQLPIIQGKIYGIEKLKEKLKDFITSVSAKSDGASLLLADSLGLVDKNFDNILASYGIEKTLTVPTVFSINNYMNLDFFLTEISSTQNPEDIIPLPNCPLILKEDDEMVLKLTKRIDNVLTKLKLGNDGTKVSASKKTGNASSKIGSDTLAFTINKFNACELGKSSTGIDSLWGKFMKSQKNSLNDMFININDNKKNVKYELQCIYSDILNSIENKNSLSENQKHALKQTTENVFAKFLDACKELSKNSDESKHEELYDDAQKLLCSILKMNHEYVWLPALANAYSL